MLLTAFRLRIAALPPRFSRAASSHQPPPPPPPAEAVHHHHPSTTTHSSRPNPHREVYRVFGRAWLKNFLVAVATYQALYWGWKKLESVEVKRETEGEIRALQGELRALTGGGGGGRKGE